VIDFLGMYRTVQDTAKVPKEHLVLGLGLLMTIVVFFGVGAGSLCSIVGFLYPAFKSFEAIETKIRGDDTQWLVYWIIFAFFSIIEVFADFLLYWIPFYYAFKMAFLLWAFLPQTRGAKFLYDSFLKDLLKKNESRIDAALADAKKQAGSIGGDVAKVANDVISEAAKIATETKKDE
jgi:receptor expression-enhancing protein 5/6